MKRGERAYGADLQRLVSAVALYARQQTERAAVGGEEEYDEVARDNDHVVSRVLPIIEQMLDEDLLEQLDRQPAPVFPFASVLEPPASPLAPWNMWSQMWKFWMGGPRAPWGRRSALPYREVKSPYRHAGDTTRTTVLLDQIIDDFRSDFLERLRQARREDRPLTDADLDELVKGLRDELNLVARRSKHRQDRVREDEQA